MSLIRYNPTGLYGSFDRFFSLGWPPAVYDGEAPRAGGFSPRVEIRHEAEAIVLEAEIPGVDKDGVKVEVHDGVLTLSGEKKVERESEENGYSRSERAYGSFSRSFTLPKEVDADNISARYKNGVLQLTLAKKPESKPKLIAIDEEGNGAKIAVK